MLDHVAHGEGAFKFLRGGYGCGKTLVARLAALDAHERGFATSFVVVSVNDLRFHNFADVYSCPAVSVSKTRMYLSVVAMSAWPSQHAHLLERAVRW